MKVKAVLQCTFTTAQIVVEGVLTDKSVFHASYGRPQEPASSQNNCKEIFY